MFSSQENRTNHPAKTSAHSLPPAQQGIDLATLLFFKKKTQKKNPKTTNKTKF
jgi:hypothetical protein